jgi:hypothetical protein
MILAFVFAPNLSEVSKARKGHGLTGTIPLIELYSKRRQFLVPSTLKTDFPCLIPENVVPCGPILLAVPPLSETDPELSAWLQKAPTILVNFGSNFPSDGNFSVELGKALRIVTDQHPTIQILCKLKTQVLHEPLIETKTEIDISEVLGRELESGRVRIESWLKADPLAILKSGNIICSVHHGGSNSYQEAVR